MAITRKRLTQLYEPNPNRNFPAPLDEIVLGRDSTWTSVHDPMKTTGDQAYLGPPKSYASRSGINYVLYKLNDRVIGSNPGYRYFCLFINIYIYIFLKCLKFGGARIFILLFCFNKTKSKMKKERKKTILICSYIYYVHGQIIICKYILIMCVKVFLDRRYNWVHNYILIMQQQS